jgi:hypothetical protein
MKKENIEEVESNLPEDGVVGPLWECSECDSLYEHYGEAVKCYMECRKVAEKDVIVDVYVARNPDGEINVFTEKPRKSENEFWFAAIAIRNFSFHVIPRGAFSEVKWEDEEPTKATLILKLNKED